MTSTNPKIDLHLTGDQISIDDMVDLAVLAEQQGLGGVWVAEAFRDPFVPLAAIAARTERVRLGTNIAQWTRTPPCLELTAGNLAELSRGRFTLGLGSSTREWNEAWHGIAYEQPLTRMRDYVTAVRALWQASPVDPVDHDGPVFAIHGYQRFNGPLASPPPIHLGATRPGMTRLAGEIADGVHFNVCMSPRFIAERMLPDLAEGARAAGRDPADVETAVLVITAVSEDAEEARRWARHQIAFYAGVASYFEDPIRFHGLGGALEEIQGLCRTGDLFAAVDAVPDEMVEHLALCGTPAQVREQIQAYAGVVDAVLCYQPSFLLGREEILRGHRSMIEAFAATAVAA